MTTGIYVISCKIADLYYIGQSSRIEARWSGHRHLLRGRSKRRVNAMLRHAWDKYGEEAFDFEILEECGVKELTIREEYWLSAYRGLGARMANFEGPSDNPMRGARHSEASREKMSLAQSGRKKSALHRERIGKAHLGRRYPEEVRRRMSESRAGRKCPHLAGDKNPSCSPQHRERMRLNNPIHIPGVVERLSQLRRSPVIDVESGQTWPSVSECAAALGVSAAAVSAATKTPGRRCKGRSLRSLATIGAKPERT